MNRMCAALLVGCGVLQCAELTIEAAQVRWESERMELSGGVTLTYENARLEAPQATVVWRSESEQLVDLDGGVQCLLADGTLLQCQTAHLDTASGVGNCVGSAEAPVRLKRGNDLAMALQLDFQCTQWQLTHAVLREQVHLVQQQQGQEQQGQEQQGQPLYFTADTAIMDPAAGTLVLESREPYQVLAWGGAQQLQLRASRLRAIQVEGAEPRIEADGSVLLSLSESQIESLVQPFQELS